MLYERRAIYLICNFFIVQKDYYYKDFFFIVLIDIKNEFPLFSFKSV